MGFKDWVLIDELNKQAPLLSQWFVGGFMHGKRQGEIDKLIEGFKLLKSLAVKPSDKLLFRASPQSDIIDNKIKLNTLSSWSETQKGAANVYSMISKSSNLPYVIVSSEFTSNEILLVVGDILAPLDDILKNAEELPYRLSNLYNNMEHWYPYQKEVIVMSTGLRSVKIEGTYE